ncbi:MAG: acyl-CoA thioesterase [Chitinophagaceae bacterium]|nr:acyl-CoA thioesterase [Chitinophagaceae bacterium]
MFSYSTPIRIHYALTDQMGVVYHGHYAQFFEIARTEAFRHLGFTYKSMEEMGIILPVVDLHTKFLRPVKYDDIIKVTITLRELPLHHKIVFHGEITNETGELCTTSIVTLYFMEMATMRRTTLPQQMKDVLLPFFQANPDTPH